MRFNEKNRREFFCRDRRPRRSVLLDTVKNSLRRVILEQGTPYKPNFEANRRVPQRRISADGSRLGPTLRTYEILHFGAEVFHEDGVFSLRLVQG